MAFTDAERLRATTLAIMRYNAIMAKEQTGGDIPIYSAPVDWIDISTITDGNINLLVSDGTLATYAFVCTTSTGTYHVDWGDGANNDYVSGEKAQHTYAIGTGQVCSRGYTTFKIVISPNVGNLTSFAIVLHSLSKYTQYHEILSCVVAATHLTTFASMFYKALTATTPDGRCPQLEQFRTVGVFPLVTSTYYMFYGCRSLQSVNTSGMIAVTDASWMFIRCKTLQFVDVSGMTEVTATNSMFWECDNLKSVDISGLTKVTDASSMFISCPSLESIDVSKMTLVTNTDNMFRACSSLKSVDVSKMISVTSAIQMFGDCISLQSVNTSGMKKLNFAGNMFSNCSNLKSINIGGMTELTNTSEMFQGCYNLESINVGGLTKVTDASYMFSGCSNLQSIDISEMIAITNASYMFEYCTSLQFANASGLANVTNTSWMFSYCLFLESVNISGMVAVTNSSYMFRECYSIQSMDISEMTEVINATYMFYGCYSIQSINVSGLTKVTDASWMFANCPSIQSIDVSDMVSVNNARALIAITDYGLTRTYISSLQSIIATNFAKNATSVSFLQAFFGCTQLTHINFPSAKMSQLTASGYKDYYGTIYLNSLETITMHPSSLLNGTNPTMDIQYNTLSAEQLDIIFTNLPTVTAKTINITGCTGAATCTRTIATAKGWTVTG